MKNKIQKNGPLRSGNGFSRAQAAARWKELDRTVDSIEKAYLASPHFSINQLSEKVLRAAKAFTGSPHGFAAYIDPATGWLTAPTMTREVWKGHPAAGKPLIFKKLSGLWGWALKNKKTILTNAAATDPRSGKIPRGHVKINKFLAAPAIFNRRLAGIITLANPARDYGPLDLAALKRLARVYAIIIQRKLAEDRLKESEEKYRRLAENLGKEYFFYQHDTKGVLTFVSPTITEMLGYPRQQFLTRYSKHLTKNPANKEAIKRTELNIRGVQQPLYEVEVYHKDGSTRWLEVTGTPLRDPAGKVTGVEGLAHDITGHKQLEQGMRESRALIAAVVENVPLMIFLKEAKHLRFAIFNRAGEELLGYDRKDLLGKNDLDLFPPEQAAFFIAKDREALKAETGVLDIPEEPIMTAKKGQRLLHTRKVCIRGADGTTKYLLGISEDITERRHTEKLLIESEETLRKIFDTAKDAIFIKDLNGVYVKANKYCAGLFGLTPEQIEGKSDFDLMPRELARQLYDSDRALLKTGGSVTADNDISTVSGGVRVFNSVKTALYDADGRVTGLLGVSRDMTELKKLQTQLIEIKAMEAAGRITRPAAHDFNNILSAINGYATLIIENLKAGNPVKSEMEQILNAVKRATAITNRLQTYGSETGKPKE
ncbi:MAG: PAS domain S-box protein [Elusimicrobiota bacterium]